MSDLIDRHEAIRDIRLMDVCVMYDDTCSTEDAVEKAIVATKRNAIFGLERMPSAEPEQRYTKEELRVFQHGISLRLLSKRSSQHWHYDEDTATEIEFLERLYEKVGADMREGEEE